MKTLTRSCLIAMLALFVVLVTTPAANAVQHHNPPFKDAEVAFLKVNVDPSLATFLVGVTNTDDDSASVRLLVRRQDGAVVFDQSYVTDGHAVKSWNLRDLNLPLVDGVFYGSLKVIGERRVLTGDYCQVDTVHNRTECNTLVPNRDTCPTSCEAYVLRFLQGGGFDGGTCVQVLHRGGAYTIPTIDVELYGEAGNQLSGFSIPDAPESSEFCFSDPRYTPEEPFGSAWIYPPTDDAVVTQTLTALDRYSAGLEAWCIPPCDRCDPLGACYNYTSSCGPQCHPPAINLSPTGDSACQVGVPCHVTFVLTGTGLEPLTCDPLPDGLVRNGNTITGTATNLAIPNIHCQVEGLCGIAERSVPVLPPGSTYGVNVEIGVRSKDCLLPGDTTADVSLDFPVTNTGSTPIVANLTTSIAGCSLSNIALNPGQTVTHNCIHGFPFGESTVTANVAIVGRPEADSASQTINITNCPQACDGVQAPTFNFSILSENNSTATTRSILGYTGAGVSGTVNFSPPPSGGFTGGNVTSGSNNDSVFPKTSSDYAATANWQVIKAGEVCHSGSANVIIHEQAGCDDYPAPTITLAEQSVLTATSKIINIVPSPAGGTFNRVVPVEVPRPLFGQPAGSETFLYSLPYSPASGLSCTATQSITVTVPPRDPGCADFPVDVIEGTPVTSQTSTQFTVQSLPYTTSPNTAGTMVWTPNPPQTYTRPLFGQPAGSASFSGIFTYTPATGLTCTAPAQKVVSIPPRDPQCSDFAVTVTPGTPVTSQTATTFTVSSIPYTTSPNTAGTMVWTPTLPDTRNRPPFGQPAGSQTYNGVFTYTPATGLSCTATASKTVSIPPQTASCADYPTTVTPGTPVTSQTNTTFTVSSIPYSTNPSRTGTMAWTPTLPDTRNRPPFGQTASQTYNGVFTYTPVTGLTCTATAQKVVVIPPQDCSTSNPPSATVTYRDQQASGTWTLYIDAALHNAGPWWVCEYATTTTTRCNAYNFDNEKSCTQVTLACGGNTTGTTSFPWQGHSAEKWRGMVFQGVKPTFTAGQPLDISHMMAETACITNTHN